MLFIIISANGNTVESLIILHREREKFVNNSLFSVKTYKTTTGDMDQKTFTDATNDVFIPKIKTMR